MEMFQTPPAGTPVEPTNGVRYYYRQTVLLAQTDAAARDATAGDAATRDARELEGVDACIIVERRVEDEREHLEERGGAREEVHGVCCGRSE